MSDRCTLRITIKTEDEQTLLALINATYSSTHRPYVKLESVFDEVNREEDGLITCVEQGADQARITDRQAWTKAGLNYEGDHTHGLAYDGKAFVSWDGTLYEVAMSINNPLLVPVNTDGIPTTKGMEDLRDYRVAYNSFYGKEQAEPPITTWSALWHFVDAYKNADEEHPHWEELDKAYRAACQVLRVQPVERPPQSAPSSMTLDQLITLANEGYGDNAILTFQEDPTSPYGDGLARFVFAELKDTFSPEQSTRDQLLVAIHQMENAIEDLEHVVEAFNNKLMSLKD